MFFGCFFVLKFTHSSFSDTETVLGNSIQAGIWGTTAPETLPEATPTETPATTSGHLVINEIFYHGGPSGEWIELYNGSSTPIDLNNWIIADNTYTDKISEISLILPQNGFAVVIGTANSGQVIAPGAIKIILGDTAIGNGLADNDRLILKNDKGETVDQMNYGSDTVVWNPARVGVTSGHSLERETKGYDTDLPDDFIDQSNPSPGI